MQLPAPGDRRIGEPVIRIELDRLLEQRKRLGHVGRGSGSDVRQRPQIQVIGVQAVGRLLPGTLDFRPLELGRDRADDVRRHLILKLEDVLQRPIEPIGPDMSAILAIYELAGNAHFGCGFSHASLQHVAHTELASDLPDVR